MIPIDFKPQTEQEHRTALKDKGWRMNNLYSIVDKGGRLVRFQQNHWQRKIFLESHGLDVYLKSRRHGITTEKALEIFDDCLHTDMILNCGLIAHTQQAAWGIFASKIRTPYDRLPDFIKKNNPAVEFSKSHVKFANGSSFHVATSFQSDTIHRLHVSEFGPMCAKFPARSTVLFSDTLPAVHPEAEYGGKASFESTADGGAGDFYELCQKARADTERAKATGVPLSDLQYMFHFLSWQSDPSNVLSDVNIPRKPSTVVYFSHLRTQSGIDLSEDQKTWYALKKDGAGGYGKKMKQHYPSTPEEAFEQSVEGSVYPDEIAEMHEQGRIGNFPHLKTHPVFTFWDLGISKGNACSIIFAQFIKNRVRIIDYYECEGRGGTYHTNKVLDKPYTWPAQDEYIYLPHDGKNRDKWTATPFEDSMVELVGAGRIYRVDKPKNKDLDGIQAVRKLFPYLEINLMMPEENHHEGEPYNGTDRFLKGISFYRYKWDEALQKWSSTPIHDFASNPADALQTLALGWGTGSIGGEYLGDDEAVAAYIEATEEGSDVEVADPLAWI